MTGRTINRCQLLTPDDALIADLRMQLVSMRFVTGREKKKESDEEKEPEFHRVYYLSRTMIKGWKDYRIGG